jgi:uroporphyrin-III C-methyltransferase/precorrin-2 dehydrogenase/sirohydrochlorin ferrochelatase
MAAAKLRLLAAADAKLTVVAAELSAGVAGLVESGRVVWLAREFLGSDLNGCQLVFSATGEDALDVAVAAAARSAGILVNVVDRPDLSDLVMPAVVDRGEIVIAISSNGGSPVLAQRIRAAIEAALPHGIERLASFARRFRGAVHSRIADHDLRRRFWSGFFDGPIAAALLAGRDRDAAREVIRAINGRNPGIAADGSCTELLVDPTQPDLITLRDLRALQQADLVIFEAGIGTAIIDLSRRDAARRQRDEGYDEMVRAEVAAGRHIVCLRARHAALSAAGISRAG